MKSCGDIIGTKLLMLLPEDGSKEVTVDEVLDTPSASRVMWNSAYSIGT